MPKIGAHVSIAGGIVNAPGRAVSLGCETFQCFTRSPQGGPAPILTQLVVADFKLQMAECGISTFYIHTPYYINFASLNNRVRFGSIKVVREELERGSVLGAKYVVTHLGSYTSQTPEEGIAKVVDALEKIMDGYDGRTELLLEIAAGSGNIIGDTFEEMAEILHKFKNKSGFTPQKLGGVCFDTCHAFASGYDFRTLKSAAAVIKEFDEKIGLNHLKLVHVNDSKFDLGSKRDRHEHIGDGCIGVEGMRSILNTDALKKLDWILETDDEKREQDIKILRKIAGK